MGKFKEHKITVLQGVLGDMAVDQLGWLSEEEQQKFWDEHNAHVKELEEKGEYGKPIEVTILMEEDPFYDTPEQPKGKATESYRFEILDLSDE